MYTIPNKPHRTAADYMVISLSPALIMALVGSLCFFLIEVFYQGKMEGSVRWVMFWFVLAIVLVSRIAIEQSSEYASIYGLALAGTVWFYMMKTQPAYLLGLVLLATVWFCAHKLVWDCTLLDEDEDSSGRGLLQARPPPKPVAASAPKLDAVAAAMAKAKEKAKKKRKVSNNPGHWVIYFSLAALPLFAIGQALLPANADVSRKRAMTFVVVYMAAALGLLVTTSFLGLRRYLRQRYLRMPPSVAFAWLKLGVGVSVLVLAGALLLPQPGASQAWMALKHDVDTTLLNASKYASKYNPSGNGDGRPGDEQGGKKGEASSPPPSENPSKQTAPSNSGSKPAPPGPSPSQMTQVAPPPGAYRLLRALVMIAGAVLFGWWLFRCRHFLLEMARGLAEAIAKFIRELLDLTPRWRPAKRAEPGEVRPNLRPFSDYKNPFYAGEEHKMPPQEIILYTYDAIRAWARERNIEVHPDRTAREFCREMGGHSPEFASQYEHLAFLYAYAAYGTTLPAHCDLDPLKELWRQFSWEHANAPVGK